MSLQQHVTQSFEAQFGEPPAFVVRAPGRVNLIGEHTDYNDGFVLPMAIDKAVWIALRPRADRTVTIYSLDLDRAASFELDDLRYENGGWVEYVKGVAWALSEAGYPLQGWDGVLTGDVPRGAGLSSSAAVELATARAFQVVSGFAWDPPAMAKLGQKAENQWVGMNCGIMDQMISAAGQAGHALLIDCRSLETQAAPLPADTVVVILDTATRRGLVDSAYNERRAQCEAAARYFAVPALRDVSQARFDAEAGGLDYVTFRRGRHIVSENDRTVAAAEAMARGDAAEMGRLMDASHASMRDDFEISGPELNVMVDCAYGVPGCYGARMTGGGFAGCAVALVETDAATDFARSVGERYLAATSLTPAIYISHASDGASVVVRN